ncbi:MAG: hypothetical protein Q8Q23_01130, partial [bacterium]|nr:hypothetical protein [bacterium]
NQVPKERLLEFIGTIGIPATAEQFFVKKKFVIDISATAPVKISFISINFEEFFLVGKGKIEEPITKKTLCFQKLLRSSSDTLIIDELGGEGEAETTLTELYALMVLQSNGEDGALLTNGCANIFYVGDDFSGVLRAVYVYWIGGVWHVYTSPVVDPLGWDDGIRVFSRNSESFESLAS